jgi:hypothetical protein
VILVGVGCQQFVGGSAMFEGLFQPVHLLVILVVVLVMVLPYWKIFKKAGFAPALSLLMLVPLVNIIMLFFLAFSEWPALKKSP